MESGKKLKTLILSVELKKRAEDRKNLLLESRFNFEFKFDNKLPHLTNLPPPLSFLEDLDIFSR